MPMQATGRVHFKFKQLFLAMFNTMFTPNSRLHCLSQNIGHQAQNGLMGIQNLVIKGFSHISLASVLYRIAPDVTPQNAASHLGLFCLLTGISSKNEIKMRNYP